MPIAALDTPTEAARPRGAASLVRNFAWILKGNLFYAASQWGLSVSIAQAGRPEMLGTFALASAIATPVFMFASLQLRAVQCTDAKQEYRFSDYLSLRLLTTTAAICVVAAIAWHRGLAGEAGLVIAFMGLAKGVESVSEIHYAALQRREWMNRIGKSFAIRAVLNICVFTAVLIATASLAWATATLVLSALLVLGCYDRPGARRLIPDVRTSLSLPGAASLRLAWKLLPLGLVMALVSLNVHLPRYFIAGEFGARELGIFAAAAYILAGANTLIEAVGQAVSPRLAVWYRTGDIAAFRELVFRLMLGGLLAGGCAVATAYVAGAWILGILYGAEYAARADVLLWVMAATPLLFSATLLGYAMTAAGYFRVQLPVFFATASTTALGCAVLLPAYGLTGAGMAFALSAAVQYLASGAVIRHACRAGSRRSPRGPAPVGTQARPLRILHVPAGLGRGGTEAWLMHILRRADASRFRMDFLVFNDVPGPYDEEIRRRGGRIIVCPLPSTRAVAFAKAFRSILTDRGPYDVVHSHIHYMNGYVLAVAAWAGVPVRIAHSHMSGEDKPAGIARALYRQFMMFMVRRYASTGIACSRMAAAAQFGQAWHKHEKFRVLHCGIDLQPFRRATVNRRIRADFGIPDGAIVVGHAGRFEPQKNHRFLIEIAKAAVAMNSDVRFLLIGDGPLREDITRLVRDAGLSGSVIMTGIRADIPDLMISAMDVLVLPSLHEGLPIVGLEAQAAGLPCLFSDAITQEVRVLPSAEFLALSEPAAVWARKLVSMASALRPPVAVATALLEHAGFSDETSVTRMETVYSSEISRTVTTPQLAAAQ